MTSLESACAAEQAAADRRRRAARVPAAEPQIVELNRCAVARSESASLMMRCRQVLIANFCSAKRPDGCRVRIEIEPGSALASISARNPPSGQDPAMKSGTSGSAALRAASAGSAALLCSSPVGRDVYAWVHLRDIPDLLQRDAPSSPSAGAFHRGLDPDVRLVARRSRFPLGQRWVYPPVAGLAAASAPTSPSSHASGAGAFGPVHGTPKSYAHRSIHAAR